MVAIFIQSVAVLLFQDRIYTQRGVNMVATKFPHHTVAGELLAIHLLLLLLTIHKERMLILNHNIKRAITMKSITKRKVKTITKNLTIHHHINIIMYLNTSNNLMQSSIIIMKMVIKNNKNIPMSRAAILELLITKIIINHNIPLEYLEAIINIRHEASNPDVPIIIVKITIMSITNTIRITIMSNIKIQEELVKEVRKKIKRGFQKKGMNFYIGISLKN